LTAERILEMEYQKSARHGTDQRPDIVFHIPAEISRAPVADNNFAVWALKHKASETEANADFGKLDDMCRALRYHLAVFVNISSVRTHLAAYTGRYADRIHSFGVPPVGGTEITHSYFDHGQLREVSYPVAGGNQTLR
jgi:hypothetical protein